jgi:outer membrane beta-barrel protein
MKLQQVMMAVLISGFSVSLAEAQVKSKSNDRVKSAPGTRVAEAPRSAPQKADVEAVKERYWSKMDDSETGVVQNRLYTKSGKLELGLFGGSIDADPFLDVFTVGGSVGYHFNEFFAVHALGWKSYSSPSSAYDRIPGGVGTSTNELNAFYGAELAWSPIYGKLSVLGKSIVYYDFHLLGGAGITSSQTGNYLTGIIGVGQQIYLGERVSLKVDYRLMPFREDIVDEISAGGTRGQVIQNRTTMSNVFTLGLTFLIGG